ncbi:PEP/pyruvate-binding domain-containing protein [Bacillus sp. D-CC]
MLQHVRKCWASLFTERAVMYRMQNDFEHNQASICLPICASCNICCSDNV